MDTHSVVSPLSHFDATSVLESLDLPVLVLDAECCVVFVSAAARALLGLGTAELRGRPVDLLFVDGAQLRRSLTRMVEAGAGAPARRLRARELARSERELALKAQAIDDEATGTHLLVQLARARPARRRAVLELLPLSVPPDHLECA